MRSMTWLALGGLALSLGCKARPPEAPTELSDLAGYLFANFEDEDTAELEAGLANLAAWLEDHYEETLEGYEVRNLPEDVVDDLPGGRTEHLDKLAGASVGYQSIHKLDPVARALVLARQDEVFPNSYDSHERTFITDKSCFMPRDCDFVATQNHVEASYPLGLKTVTDSRSEYRWVPFEGGDAFIHRTWLTKPAQVNFNWVDVHDQFYLGVTLPWGDGILRLGTTWIAATILDGGVPEKTALNMMIGSMQKEGENLDAYLSER